MFTWSNNQENPTLEKLDRILINHDWENIFPLSSARKIPRVMSDHNPIILDTKESVEVRSREFRFEKSWLLQPDFQLRVDKAWKVPVRGSDSISVVQEKLRNVKNSLKGWGANVRGESLKIKRDLLSELEKLENLEEDNVLPGPLFTRKGEIQFKLMKIYEEEELYWFRRSSEKWLLEGDNNTAYFHRVANGRRRKNTMYSLKKDDIHIQGTADLLTHATEYYKMLFGPREGNLMQLADSVWSVQEKLSDEDNIKLNEPFSEEEIQATINSMVKNKAPGPDGIPIEFYQACWPIIKNDIMNIFYDWKLGVLDLYRLNFGMIILLQKAPDADVIQKYRPICLLQVLYKWLTKVATLRVEPFMSKLISPCQTAFIKGRNIMDGVMSLHEILHEAKRKKQQGVVLKLDFEKAYDKVDWNYLMKCISQKGFCGEWCTRINGIIRDGTLCVKINNTRGKDFGSHRGVRQGDPFSPFLFNIAAEGLAKMIAHAQEAKLVTGLVPHLIENGVVILQYADDTILLIQDDMEQIIHMKLILYMFEAMSGLKINFLKSEIMMVLHDDEKKMIYSDIFGCQLGDWPIKYLGVPVCGTRLRVSDVDYLSDKLMKKLDGWVGHSSSIGGRFSLIQSSLSSTLIYHMSMYLLPLTNLEKLTKIIRKFFWGGEIVKKENTT
jgi:hypothetical protein